MKVDAIERGELIQVRDGDHWVFARAKQIEDDEVLVHVNHSGNHEHGVRKHVDAADCRGIDQLAALLAIAKKAPQQTLFAQLSAQDPFVLKLDPQRLKRADLIDHYQSQIDRLQEDADARKEAAAK